MGKAISLSAFRGAAMPAGLAAAIGAAYWAAMPGAWLYDDALAVTGNESLRRAATALMPPANGSPVAGRPLLNASFAADWAIGGSHPAAYLATNLVIHWLAACALWGVLRRTAVSARWAGAAALAWAVHPLCTSGVAYVSQRAESLAALLCLFALYAMIRGWRAAAVAACAAGMAVKETMVVAPIILWLYDGAFLAGSPGTALRRRKGFYAALAATWVLLAALVIHEGSRNGTAGFGSGVSAVQYAAVQGAAVLHYLRLAAWPRGSMFLYPRILAPAAGDVAADVICLLLASASVYAYVRGPRGAGFLGLAFFLWLAPSSSVLPISTEIRAEHRMYLPLAAIITLLAAVLWRASAERNKIWRAGAIGTGMIAAWGVLTGARARDYSDAVRMWTVTAQQSPGDPRVWNNLGTTRLDAHDPAAAVAAFDRALSLRPGYPEAHVNRGLALAALDRYTDAAVEFETALRISPTYEKARANAAQAWLLLGNRAAAARQTEAAVSHFRRALALDPNDVAAHGNLGLALASLGRNREALPELEFAAAARPQDRVLRHNLDVVRRRLP